MDAAMRFPFHTPSAAPPSSRASRELGTDPSLAELWLGRSHRLVGLLRAFETARDQLVWVTAVLAAGLVFWSGGRTFGLALAVAALVVQAGLVCRLGALRASRRQLCLEMIVDGHVLLPVSCLQRELARLQDRQTRERLARSIDEILKTAARPLPLHHASRPLFRVWVVRAVASELGELASSLRSQQPGVRGVAAVELLLTSSSTSLYGTEVDPLREQVSHARYLLRGGR